MGDICVLGILSHAADLLRKPWGGFTLQSKGVASVRSRVVNLRELNPEVTIEGMKTAMAEAFSKVYGLPVVRLYPSMLDKPYVDSLCRKNGSWEWLYGQKTPFTFQWEERFSWGELQINLAPFVVLIGFVIARSFDFASAISYKFIIL